MPLSHSELLERLADALSRSDVDAIASLLTDDYTETRPQKGEVVKDRARAMAIRASRPARTSGASTVNVVHQQEHGDRGAATLRTRYPDGSDTWTAMTYTRRGDEIASATVFFAPAFEAPDWRVEWVERGGHDTAPPIAASDMTSARLNHYDLFMLYVDALRRADLDDWVTVITDDFIEVYPQSGELVRGPANARAVRENYPGGFDASSEDTGTEEVTGESAEWDLTPMLTMVRVHDCGQDGTASYRASWPDGSYWWVVLLYQRRGDQIARATVFFAPEMPPSDWREEWASPLPA